MIKNYFRILKKPHAYLQTILKTPVKFQKDRTETVGGVKGTKYLLKTQNHAPRATPHTPRKTKNSVPPLFFEKAGDNKNKNKWLHCIFSEKLCTSNILIWSNAEVSLQYNKTPYVNCEAANQSAYPYRLFSIIAVANHTNILDPKKLVILFGYTLFVVLYSRLFFFLR